MDSRVPMTSTLYTWRDIESKLAEVANPPWISATADREQLTIVCHQGMEEAAASALKIAFGARYTSERLRLEATPESPRTLPVSIIADVDSSPRPPRIVRPLWRDATLLDKDPAPENSSAVRVAAFFSYKGGVGRSSCLLATAGALLQRKSASRLLIVDADLEAPGITWSLPGSNDRISLLDSMSLIHDEDDWKANAIPLIAARLNKNQETLELQTGRASFFFLPAFRDFAQVFNPSVTFEQLVRSRGRTHVVGDAFIAIGEALDVDAVLVDLRAGITEFSSPLLLDPRVLSVLVTSCNEQSVEGTVRTLERMGPRAKSATRPEVVISMVPPGEPASLVMGISERIIQVLPFLGDDDVGVAANRAPHRVDFAQELLHYSSIEDFLLNRVPGTTLGKLAALELGTAILPEHRSGTSSPRKASKTVNLKRVAEEAEKLEYAEGNEQRDLLPTQALVALGEQFPGILPTAVVLGAKGAGKTFAWGQMVLSKTWGEFISLVSQSKESPPDASIFPLLGPANLTPTMRQHQADAEKMVWDAIGTSRRHMSIDALRTELEKFARQPDELGFWTRAIAARLGLPTKAGASAQALEAALRTANTKVLLVIDGIEDAFQPSPDKPLTKDKRRVLRGLLQRLTNQIREMDSAFLGLITLVRRDLAEEAIDQNFGQFESLHNKFSLLWSPTEALRLVVWLLERAGSSVMEQSKIARASYDDLSSELELFWGERMGSEKSREAHTDRWVIAALSDLQGRLQPRDIVRLVKFAAGKVTVGNQLTPRSLRESLAECSEKKITELQIEVKGLKPLFDRFRRATEDKRAIPFLAKDFKLTPDDVTFLKRQGVLTNIEDGSELYMPEIIRQGLKFKLKEGRRAKVLTLYYRAAQLKLS